MYKDPATGKRKTSFSRLMSNAFPVVASDPMRDPPPLSPNQKDALYLYQLQLPWHEYLTDESFYVACVCDYAYVSKKLYRACQKIGVIGENGSVDTTKIGKGFTNKLAVVSVVRQKMIVDLLFWWEGEMQRLIKLRGERNELIALVRSADECVVSLTRDDGERHERGSGSGRGSGNGNEDGNGNGEGRRDVELREDELREAKANLERLRLLLDRVNMKICWRPSQRRADVEADQDEVLRRMTSGDMAPLSSSITSPAVSGFYRQSGDVEFRAAEAEDMLPGYEESQGRYGHRRRGTVI